MPLFPYRCTKCGKRQEELASVYGELRPWDVCNACGAKKLKRVPSAANVNVKDGTPKFYGGKE